MLIKKAKLGAACALALLGSSVAFVPQEASAVNIAEDGLGEVALFQYYTANSDWQTFIRLINTSDEMVPVKVRFRRATDSADVLDFIVALSPRDMWVGWVDDDVDGAGNAGVITFDSSCLSPAPADAPNDSGWNKDPAIDGRKFVTFKAENATEGHIEVISLGRTGPFGQGSPLYIDTLHDPDTDEPSCTQFGAAFTPGQVGPGVTQIAGQFLEPNNELKANAYLINQPIGQAFSYDPVMLANFSNPALGIVDDGVPSLIPAGSLVLEALADEVLPDLNSAFPPTSRIEIDTPLKFIEQLLGGDADFRIPGPTVVYDAWDRGIDAVSAVLTQRSIVNEWAARQTPDRAVKNYDTEWVATFPTRYPNIPEDRNFYFVYDDDGVPAIAPFTDGGTPIAVALWNREERTRTCVSGIGQNNACDPNNELPWETNVITFRDEDVELGMPSALLGSEVATNIPEAIMPRPDDADLDSNGSWLGWMEMVFAGEQAEAGLGSDPRGNQIYDDSPLQRLAYSTGQTIVLRDAGGTNQEYCLYDLQTAGPNLPVTDAGYTGACDAVTPDPDYDPQNVCGAGGTVVPDGPGVAPIIFDVPAAGGDLADVTFNIGTLVNPIPATLTLVGAVPAPFLQVGNPANADKVQPESCIPAVNAEFAIRGNGVTYAGVPVIGFAAHLYNLDSPTVNYATATAHGYKRDVRLEDQFCAAGGTFGFWTCLTGPGEVPGFPSNP